MTLRCRLAVAVAAGAATVRHSGTPFGHRPEDGGICIGCEANFSKRQRRLDFFQVRVG
jgi:hypothetical protein